MRIKYKNTIVEVNRVKGDFSCFVNVVGVGKRRIYEDVNKQAYINCFGAWFMFPQEIEY